VGNVLKMERKGDGWVGEKKKASKSVAGALLVTCHVSLSFLVRRVEDPALACLSTR
jgi:hypothetical protein